jgi:hypothetical protein
MAARPEAEYKVIIGNTEQVQQELNALAIQNWKPILMSTTQTSASPVAITVILEHVLGKWDSAQ